MNILLLTLALLAQAPTPPVPLKEAIKDFPRSQLQVKASGPVAIEVSSVRAGYERLAGLAGLSVVFDADFRDNSTLPFRIDTAAVLPAFDLLSTSSGTFVEVLDSRTIIVAPNNPTKRRDYGMQVIKTFYLPNGTPLQNMSETVTRLRTVLQAREVAMSTAANAIILRDSPDRIVLAEQMIASTTRITSAPPVATNAAGHVFTLEAGVIRNSTPARSALKVNVSAPLSFRMNENSRTLFGNLARTAGLNILFDPDFRGAVTSFSVENAGVLDALDQLALQTRTFWEVLDGKTIMIAPDSLAKRRDYELQAARTFYLADSQQGLSEIITVLRTVLGCRFIAMVPGANAIVVRDNANRLALAEKIITDIVKPAGSVSAGPAIPVGAESAPIFARRAARSSMTGPSELQPKVTGPFSFDLNVSAARMFEALADQSGLNIAFDRRFQDSPAVQFKVDGVDIFDALDDLSLATGNMWEIGDSATIIVGANSPAVWRDTARRVSKTIAMTRFPLQSISEIGIVLRTLLNLAQLDASGNTIAIMDTPYNIAIAEQIISSLDRPAAR